MHDRDALGWRAIAFEPSEPELERGVRLTEEIERVAILRDLVLMLELRSRVDGDAVDRGQCLAALRGELRSHGCPFVVAEDLAGDRLAGHGVTHDERPIVRRPVEA